MSAEVFKVGAVWHYRFQVKPFPRVQRSTRLRDRTAAGRVADKAYAATVVRANGGDPVPTLNQLLVDWLDVRGRHSSAHHIRSVETFGRLHTYGMDELLISQLDTDAVERARSKHLATHSHASANHWLRVLKLLVRWAVRREILPRLPWSVTMLPVQKRVRAILPLSAAMAWFAAVDRASTRSPSIGVAARLMLWLGLRESEVITARWEWIDWERGTYTPGKTKGKEADALKMMPWLVNYLTPLRQSEGLIVCRADGSPYGAGLARRAIRVANATCSTKGITPHRLRGTIATVMSENGAPIQSIQAYLRHKDVRTTMAYLEKNTDLIDTAQAKIAEKAGLTWRESGERPEGEPYRT
ncbi:tyrosine-type recombinase/integrase [Rugamonas aquatica]|uniref:Tyrosine-type recombinase/integrase n=1 Tax=Rugamonas aquatica TaxID=2743357 RepID=A0A6A7N2F1_9BURK|nr:site-specific integrase [Rugamonas aquatica]MQA39018.1 tyrosine-type recombinase/integrase [Rugamonas aquatica]